METILRLADIVETEILVTREAARSLESHIFGKLVGDSGRLILDFEGIEGLTPSFMDELLEVIENQLNDEMMMGLEVVVLNPPTRLSSKFAAVARGRGLSILETDDQSWLLKGAA